MKKCTKCKEDKSEDFFYKKKNYKNGLSSICKDCEKSYHANKYIHNKEHIAKRSAEWAKNNKEKKSVINKASAERNREKRNEQSRLYKKRNKGIVNSRNAFRRASVRQATPPWLTQDQKQDIRSMYTLAQKFEKAFDANYHVDHIVPLNGENVCGLHVPWNLQILEQKVNLKKSNKLKSQDAFR
jgi:5-methylcytosine-specific restriction endonuclease McrA